FKKNYTPPPESGREWPLVRDGSFVMLPSLGGFRGRVLAVASPNRRCATILICCCDQLALLGHRSGHLTFSKVVPGTAGSDECGLVLGSDASALMLLELDGFADVATRTWITQRIAVCAESNS